MALLIRASGMLAALLLTAAAVATTAEPAAEPSREALVKAAFLHKFTLFVDWPAAAFADPGVPFRIGVLGRDPLGGVLDEIIAGESVRGRPLVALRAADPAALRDCQIVYVGDSEAHRLDDVLAAFAGKPVLLASDLPRFAERGGGVRFYRDGGRLRFEINAASLDRRGLRASAQLLALARLVPASGRSP